MQMPFGKHKGRSVYTLPTDYLWWLWDNVELSGRLSDAVENALSVRGEPLRAPGFRGGGSDPPPASMELGQLRQRLTEWYRKLSLKFHPDRGGSRDKMAALNLAQEELHKILDLP